jgi:WD40 repeat protein
MKLTQPASIKRCSLHHEAIRGSLQQLFEQNTTLPLVLISLITEYCRIWKDYAEISLPHSDDVYALTAFAKHQGKACIMTHKKYDDSAQSSQPASLTLWNLENGSLLTQIHDDTQGVIDMCTTPNGKTLALCTKEGNVRLYNMDNISKPTTFSLPEPFRFKWGAIAITPDAHLIAVANHNAIYLCNTEQQKIIKSKSVYLETGAESLAFSPHKRYIVTCHGSKIFAWDTITDSIDIHTNLTHASVDPVYFYNDTTFFTRNNHRKELLKYHLSHDNEQVKISPGEDHIPEHVIYSYTYLPNKSLFALEAIKDVIIKHDAIREPIATLPLTRQLRHLLSFSTDGAYLAARARGSIYIFHNSYDVLEQSTPLITDNSA